MPDGRRRGPGRQRKRRGMRLLLRPALLLMLAERESHGYELMDQIASLGFDPDCLDSSIVYRDLREMEEMGLIGSTWDEEESKGPKRRVYQIRELGWDRLQDWIGNLRDIQAQIEGLADRYSQASQKRSKP